MKQFLFPVTVQQLSTQIILLYFGLTSKNSGYSISCTLLVIVWVIKNRTNNLLDIAKSYASLMHKMVIHIGPGEAKKVAKH